MDELSDDTNAHPNKQANITVSLNKEKIIIGQIYQVHPTILSQLKIENSGQVVFGGIDLDTVNFVKQNQKSEKVSSYLSFQDQIVFRDLCFVTAKESNFGKILNNIKKIPEIIDAEIFDLYEGKNLPDGTKSISITMSILGDGNFDTAKINAIMNQAIQNAEKTGAKLRE